MINSKIKIVSTIAGRIAEGLDLCHMSQSDLSRATGIGRSSISTYISGEYEPKQKNIYKIALALNVSESWLMGYDVPKERNDGMPLPDNVIPITALIPVYGAIPAGEPAFAEQNILGYAPIYNKNPADYFALKVRGKSMIGARIADGSTVIIQRQPCAEDGDIVACRLNGDEATLKRFKRQGSTILLLPENPEFEPRIVPAEAFENGEAEILGVVRQILIDV